MREIFNPYEINYGGVIDRKTECPLVCVTAIDVANLCRDGLNAIRIQAYADHEAMEKTFVTGFATFWSWSRGGLRTKGEESGNILPINAVYADCDMDSLILDVSPVGPTCHIGAISCFNT